MDCAKAAAFISVNDGDINDYIFNRLKSGKALPIILIPTTCGTGSEGNGFAVLTNPVSYTHLDVYKRQVQTSKMK